MKTIEARRLLLRVDEVSELTGWSRKDIYKRKAELPGFVKVGKSVRFRLVPLMRWLRGDDSQGDGSAR